MLQVKINNIYQIKVDNRKYVTCTHHCLCALPFDLGKVLRDFRVNFYFFRLVLGRICVLMVSRNSNLNRDMNLYVTFIVSGDYVTDVIYRATPWHSFNGDQMPRRAASRVPFARDFTIIVKRLFEKSLPYYFSCLVIIISEPRFFPLETMN